MKSAVGFVQYNRMRGFYFFGRDTEGVFRLRHRGLQSVRWNKRKIHACGVSDGLFEVDCSQFFCANVGYAC